MLCARLDSLSFLTQHSLGSPWGLLHGLGISVFLLSIFIFFLSLLLFFHNIYFLRQYSHLQGGKIKNTCKRERKNTMLQHLQLIKPKMFYKFEYRLQNCKIKHDTMKT